MIKQDYNKQKFYQDKGYLDMNEKPKFRISLDACNCLGQEYDGFQKGYCLSKKYPGYSLWFPNFTEKNQFSNKMLDDILIDKAEKIEEFEKSIINPPFRLTFPKISDGNGNDFFTFMGVYKMDIEKSSFKGCRLFKRIATRFDL